MTLIFDNITFAQLFKHNPRDAFEYRKNTLGDPIPFEYLNTDEKKQGEIQTNNDENRKEKRRQIANLIRDNTNIKITNFHTLEELEQIAKDNGIEF